MIARVLAVDPGKATGIALLERDINAGTVDILETAELHVLSDDETDGDHLRSLILGWRTARQPDEYPTRIVIERFTITPGTGKKSQEAKSALETIGAVKWFCVQAGYPLEAIEWQAPGDAKEAFPNEKLKRLGLWHRGGAGHALDALRHAALYLVTTGWSDQRMFE